MNNIGSVLFAFFEDHLKIQKGLSTASIKSYRDTLKLFLVWVAKTKHRHLTKLTLTDLTADQVLAFLRTIEIERNNQIRTRNQRLAALRTFYRFLAVHIRKCSQKRNAWKPSQPNAQQHQKRSTWNGTKSIRCSRA